MPLMVRVGCGSEAAKSVVEVVGVFGGARLVSYSEIGVDMS